MPPRSAAKQLPKTRPMRSNSSESVEGPGNFLGKHAQIIIDVNQKLKQLGIDETVRLPQICVIGDQSAGKSSLIEALSNISVPKADGTCTRCPILINLANGDQPDSPWQCVISIEYRYEYTTEKKITKKNPFGPWERRSDLKIETVKTIYDKTKVPELIAMAQDQVLSGNELKFSPNTVRLDIKEGLQPNLCFIDLPGIISNVANRSDYYLIGLVRSLVKEYASDPNSENILALPMSADVNTSAACSIIQELDVESKTLAVFTKPDCVKAERQQYFIEQYLIQSSDQSSKENDEKLRFKNGCHFVMLADEAVGHSIARQSETAFFNEPAWKGVPTNYHHRFGVLALRQYLRNQLFQKTREGLPSNLVAIEQELSNIEQQLAKMPDIPNKAHFCMALQLALENFTKELSQRFCGDSEHSAKAPLKQKFEEFAESILTSCPILDHGTKDETREIHNAAKKLKEFAGQNKKLNTYLENRDRGSADDKTAGHRFRLEHLREINRQFDHAGIPGAVDPRSINKACCESLSFWNTLLKEHLQNIHEVIQEQLEFVFKKVFQQYQSLGVFHMVGNWIKEYLTAVMKNERRIAETICMAEMSSPFTLNDKSLERLKVTSEAELSAKRLAFRTQLFKFQEDIEEGTLKTGRNISDKLPDDEWKAEISLGAKVIAYYQIASKRFIDTTCQGLFARLIPACGEELAIHLKEHIDVHNQENDQKILELMAEDPKTEEQRQKLLYKQHQLIEGRKYIEDVLEQILLLQNGESPSKRDASVADDSLEESPTKRQRLVHRSVSVEIPAPESQVPANEDDVETLD